MKHDYQETEVPSSIIVVLQKSNTKEQESKSRKKHDFGGTKGKQRGN